MTTELLRPVTDPKSLSLYPYQAEAIESLRVAARAGYRRIILCAPTGSLARPKWLFTSSRKRTRQRVKGDLRGGRNLSGGADQCSPGILRD